jgi:hypothetical protein
MHANQHPAPRSPSHTQNRQQIHLFPSSANARPPLSSRTSRIGTCVVPKSSYYFLDNPLFPLLWMRLMQAYTQILNLKFSLQNVRGLTGKSTLPPRIPLSLRHGDRTMHQLDPSLCLVLATTWAQVDPLKPKPFLHQQSNHKVVYSL